MKEFGDFDLNITEVNPQILEGVAKLVKSAKLETTYLPFADPLLILRNEQDEIVACAGLERRGDYVYLQSLAVRKDQRKKGLGSFMVEKAYDRLNEGDTMIALTLFWNNHFYKGLGFEHLDAKTTKSRDDIGAREKHIFCTAWGKKKSNSQLMAHR